MSNKTLYIIRGVPGSGKSTLAHQLTKNVVETDDFMMVDGEYKYDKDKVYACHKKCFNKVLDYMANGVTPIAVANTFIKKKDYKPYVDLAKEFGYDVEIKVCKGDYKNVHNVPQDRVEQMKSKFQESINSLLEMNGDVGITEAIENKKQSVCIKVDESNNFLSKNVKFVTSPSQILSILKSQNGGYRILYDKNLDMYMIGHVDEVIHQDMLEYAYKSGLYYNLEDFIDGVGGLQNYIEIGVDGGYDSQDNEIEPYLYYMIFDPYNEWKIGDDGYDNLYKLKFGNLLTRKCDIKDIPLYNLLVSKVVFDPNQIKSVDNNGNWSLNNNINESKEPKLNDNFWKWFGNSKVVDENGNPMVCYHGTPQEFNEFDKSKRGIHSKGPGAGVGFWFSTSPEYFNYYKNHMEVYLSIQNPKIFKTKPYTRIELQLLWDMYNNEKDSDERYFIYKLLKGVSGREDAYDHFLWDLYSSNNQIPINQNFYGDLRDIVKLKNPEQSYENYINKLKSKGYDGIIIIDTEYDSTFTNGKNNTQIIAFEPNQIKSVKNNGNWSLNSDNINEGLGQALNYGFLYHGTDYEFDEFSKDYQNGGFLGNGFYFTLSKSMARHYGKNIISAKLKYNSSFFFDSDVLDEKSIIKMLSTIPNLDKNTLNTIKAKYLEQIKYKNYYEANKDLFDYIDFYHGDSTKILKELGYDSIDNIDRDSEFVVFEPNQIEIIKDDGYWLLEVDDINEEKEVIEERLFPELSDRKYNELLWFTTPNMTANAYTKFFGKEMIADRIPAKYLVTLSSNDISLKDLVEKHRKLYNAKQVKPIADYKDFNDFITDLNKSKYLSRNDKSNIAKSGAKIIKSFGDWDLYDITTWEAAKKYGSGTTWCVTDSTSDDYFKRYTNRLPFNNYQTEEDMKKSIRSLLFLINPNTDRKMAISVFKRIDYDWYNDEIEFYNEEDEFFYTCSHTSKGSISSKDDIMEKITYYGDDWPDADVVEDYGVTEDFIMSVIQFIKDTYRMNKEQIVEDVNKVRQKYKQLMNIKESANYSTNMTWEEFVEKVGRENEFDGSAVILKHNTSIVIRQSGTILVRIGKNPFKKAYSNLKTFDEIYNMLVEKGFVEEQLLTEGVNQHSLYHGCDLAYAVSMMIDNAMRGETIANINGKKYQGNSLTRSLQFAKDWQEESWDGQADELNQFWVVLELNKERLKTKYKVLPYNYWEEYFGQDYEHTIDRNGYGDQYEEFVVGRINNLMYYMDDVYLSDECLYGEYAEILAIVKRELELRGENYTDSQIVKALQTLGIDKPSPDDLNKTKINENYKKLSDDSGIVEVFSYNDIKGFVNRCRFGARGLLNNNNGKVYLADSFDLYHGDMVDELVDLGENITYDSIVRFMVYNDKFKALDSEYGEEYRYGNHSISILTNGDLYVLFKDYNFMNDSFENMLKLETMEDLEDEDDSDDSGWKLSENEEYEKSI